MAPTRDKWVRRFVIPETTTHKKGFTIYKVTSVVFLKSSHEEISKVSVWKRYNDFRKLHCELSLLYSESRSKESFPSFPKPKFFGRFETEVIEERRECALKLLEFIGRHSYLYSSDVFIKFFETSHGEHCLSDCSQSLSSDTSAEDDLLSYINSLATNETSQSIQNSLMNLPKPNSEINQSDEKFESIDQTSQQHDIKYKIDNEKISMTKNTCNNLLIEGNSGNIVTKLENNELVCKKNNTCKDKNSNVQNMNSAGNSTIVQTLHANMNTGSISIEDLNSPLTTHDGSDLPQIWPDSSQYILVAAAHMSAAFKHEDLTEYEEAFMQYKMGISSLRSGIESDSNKIRTDIIKEKISKYLQRAEKLYNRYLNCNISLLSKPTSELQYYKVLKIVDTVMLVKDVRQNCLNIVKAIEKLSSGKESITNYVLRGQIPYMVHLHACIETESSVFLILQYLNRGKLWDFIKLHYNSDSNAVCDNTITRTVTEKMNKGNDSLWKKHIKDEVQGLRLSEQLDLISTNTKVQIETNSISIDENCENCKDMSTTQLLEKAQILLQSVNATLKESNSVANRLCESGRLVNKNSTSLFNLKNALHPSTDHNKFSVNINDVSLQIDDVRKNVENGKTSDTNVMTSKYLSQNYITSTKSQSNSPNLSISNRFKSFNLDRRDSTISSTDNLKANNTHFSIECKYLDKNRGAFKEYTLNKSIENYDKTETNAYCISDGQEIRHSTFLVESKKFCNVDTERVLWVIPENLICIWAAEILLALEALHQQEVIVLDLKPNNILLDDNGHVQLTYIIPRHDIDLLKYKHPYSSPELCAFSPMIPLTSATDIWSFGIILYELIVGNKFQIMNPGTFSSHSTISIPGRVSENAKSLLLNILKYEPNERMTIPEMKQHPFFKDVNWASMVNTV